MASESTLNPFEISQRQLDKAAETLQLDPQIHQLLREPMRTLEVHFPVRMVTVKLIDMGAKSGDALCIL